MKNATQSTKSIALVRDSRSRSLWRHGFRLIPIAVASLALLLTAQAVSPPPGGGYSNFDTTEGTDALFSLTTGVREGRFRSGKIRPLGKHKVLQKSKRPRRAKNAKEEPSLPAVGTLARSKRLILAAIRVWELKRGIPG
jgi:hypothetical protein